MVITITIITVLYIRVSSQSTFTSYLVHSAYPFTHHILSQRYLGWNSSPSISPSAHFGRASVRILSFIAQLARPPPPPLIAQEASCSDQCSQNLDFSSYVLRLLESVPFNTSGFPFLCPAAFRVCPI